MATGQKWGVYNHGCNVDVASQKIYPKRDNKN